MRQDGIVVGVQLCSRINASAEMNAKFAAGIAARTSVAPAPVAVKKTTPAKAVPKKKAAAKAKPAKAARR